MVKKISGTTPSRATTATTGVKASQEVQTAKQVGGVDQVGSVKGRQQLGQTRGATRPMTAEERELLLKLVDEEADRLFAHTDLSETRKRTITQSIKMTLAAGSAEGDE